MLNIGCFYNTLCKVYLEFSLVLRASVRTFLYRLLSPFLLFLLHLLKLLNLQLLLLFLHYLAYFNLSFLSIFIYTSPFQSIPLHFLFIHFVQFQRAKITGNGTRFFIWVSCDILNIYLLFCWPIPIIISFLVFILFYPWSENL